MFFVSKIYKKLTSKTKKGEEGREGTTLGVCIGLKGQQLGVHIGLKGQQLLVQGSALGCMMQEEARPVRA